MSEHTPGEIRFVLYSINAITEFLNMNSEWFKGSKNPKVVVTYDTLKSAFQKVREAWYA